MIVTDGKDLGQQSESQARLAFAMFVFLFSSVVSNEFQVRSIARISCLTERIFKSGFFLS